jgi:type IV secretory pathway VirB4 component
MQAMTELEERTIAAIYEKLANEQNQERKENVLYFLKLYQSSTNNDIKTSVAKCLSSYLENGILPTETISLLQQLSGGSIGCR